MTARLEAHGYEEQPLQIWTLAMLLSFQRRSLVHALRTRPHQGGAVFHWPLIYFHLARIGPRLLYDS